MTSAARTLRRALPFVVSAGLLAFLFSRIDLTAALAYVTPSVAGRFVVPLVAFNVVTLAIEARCLDRVVALGRSPIGLVAAGRIRAAVYLLSTVNHALGALALSVLLRRRAGLGLSEAASMVFLITLFDVACVLVVAVLGSGWQQLDAGGLRLGLAALLIAAIAAGLVFLRTPASLGPLEAIRQLDVFRAPRTAPLSLLVELGLLRALFLAVFVGLAAGLFHAFAIDIAPLRLATGMALLILVSALPIAVAGLGTGQIAFVTLFRGAAPPEELLAASLVLSGGLVATRSLLGLAFAPEFLREAIVAARSEATVRGDGGGSR